VLQCRVALKLSVPAQYLSDVKPGRRAVTELFAQRVAAKKGFSYEYLMQGQCARVAQSTENVRAYLPVHRRRRRHKRELLDVLCLNRVLDDATLYLEWRKPFDTVAETAKTGFGIPNRRSFEPFINAFVEPITPHLLAAQRLAVKI